VVIPNGWEPADVPACVETSHPRGGIRIAFVGTLGNATPPESFLKTLAELLQRAPSRETTLRLTFVGYRSKASESAVRAFPYQELVELIDEVPRPEALRIMRRADVLLLLNPSPWARYRQGKLYDYLAMETPILVYGSGGEAAALVDEFDAGRVVPASNVEALESALAILPGLRGRAAQRGVHQWLARHTREYLAGQMIDLLEGIVSGPGHTGPK
jgi:glycosyltransferase involved in cell wall biosynthesis